LRSKIRNLLAQTVNTPFPSWLQYFDTINSTNNYAMQLVDDGLAQHGTVIWANHQQQGKGQRGKSWVNGSGNIMMSLIVKPRIPSDQQFVLSMLVACTITTYLLTISQQWQVAIKWPNDIYINDKKACGVLIENTFRGSEWTHAIIGMGLNVNQDQFGADLNLATSMYQALQQKFDRLELVTDIRAGLLNALQYWHAQPMVSLINLYNQHLFKRNESVGFRDRDTGLVFEAVVKGVNPYGQLELSTTKGIQTFNFGSIDWLL
jgi:BirA family biotin operon repressor/biotin-[acetyl-CoA-carboxylase] ligase